MSAVVPGLPTTESPLSRDGSLARLQPEPALQKKRFYLPEVDGIRCLAVLLVWIHHYPVGPGLFLHQLRDERMGGRKHISRPKFVSNYFAIGARGPSERFNIAAEVLQQTVSADLAAFGAGASPELFTFTCDQLLPGGIW